jgi:hypothetical protein
MLILLLLMLMLPAASPHATAADTVDDQPALGLPPATTATGSAAPDTVAAGPALAGYYSRSVGTPLHPLLLLPLLPP